MAGAINCDPLVVRPHMRVARHVKNLREKSVAKACPWTVEMLNFQARRK